MPAGPVAFYLFEFNSQIVPRCPKPFFRFQCVRIEIQASERVLGEHQEQVGRATT